MRNLNLLFLILLGACKGGGESAARTEEPKDEAPRFELPVVGSADFCTPASWNCRNMEVKLPDTTIHGVIACKGDLQVDVTDELGDIVDLGDQLLQGLIDAGVDADGDTDFEWVELPFGAGWESRLKTAAFVNSTAEVSVVVDWMSHGRVAGDVDPGFYNQGVSVQILNHSALEYLGVCDE